MYWKPGRTTERTPQNLERNGKKVEAVAQITKQGYVLLFDRRTGEPLFELEEKPFPPSTLAGEEAWPTQSVPVKPKPFARYAEKDWVAVDGEMIHVDTKAAVQLAFEVPEKKLDMLVLSIDAEDVAPVSELIEEETDESS